MKYLTILIINIVLIVGGVFLLGIPGVLYMEIISRTFYFTGLDNLSAIRHISGDASWPAAIMMTIFLPPILFVCEFIKRKVNKDKKIWLSILLYTLITYIWGLFLFQMYLSG